ncbi:ACT domain-containing protein [Nitratireductor kimnyeongensis]|uniref:ACT domain-containing protein n=1 Tax=Nitratireductor kimnyeongensis TaxID=430679 RepID=A0ABW0TB29_9HYPH|nr:ACT domain-containing protein [Nitratireductor kimnyeongensis]QZZ36648.1 ACT domain-containing protein [Nitratireductor kimnyeongensis]
MTDPIRERHSMLSGLRPVLSEGVYVFCTARQDTAGELLKDALGAFKEEEGVTLVLSLEQARAHGFDTDMPMRRIVLNVYSALDGVGLTGSVATALAEKNIPCNMIAAFHHDHIFVPEKLAEKALSVLLNVQQRAKANAVNE